jgi:HNH endonuclease
VLAASAPPAAVSRRLAADLLQAQLLRLARAGALIERRLGPGLLALGARHLYRRLGFVRLGDYLTERLGISLRRCQSIVRLERALRDLPAVAAAFDAGAVPPSKVRIVASAATPETQHLWLARAQRLTVRDLEAAARAARDATSAAEAAPDAVTAAHSAATVAGPEQGAAAPAPAPEDEPGVLISFAAPGRAFALWQWAIEFVRRVAGQQEPPWRCAEYLAAEFLSGCPDAEAPEAEATDQAHARSEPVPVVARLMRRCAISDDEVWVRAVAAVRDALRPLGTAADVETILSAPSPAAPAVPPDSMRAGAPVAASDAGESDPWDLDARLRGLVRLRQSLAWRQGRLLAAVASFDLHRELGYDSLGDWCRSVLGMSPRRARYLVSLDRRLDRIPLVADAYRRGLVSWCQARLLVRVARPGTESRWIRYARRVTVRRLEDAITACAVAVADPTIGGQAHMSQDSAPLPPSEPLPGTPPTRHTLAPVDRSSPIAGDAAPSTALSANVPDPARHTLTPKRCTHRIAFWAPLDVADVWRSALRACRRARGPHLRDWECLLVFIIEMRDAWQPHENAEWRRRYHILDRDGWRCLAPGCTSRSHLNVHHLVFRSHSGSDDASNLVTLCVGHHQAGVHDNLIRCYGRAPDAIWWDFGVRPDAPPLVRYFGDRIVSARADVRPATSPDGGSLRRHAAAGTAPAGDSSRDRLDERTLAASARAG